VTPADDFVIQLALDKGVLTQTQIDSANAKIAEHTDLTTTPPKLIDILIANKAVEARQLSKLLADEFGMPLVDLPSLRVPSPEAMALIPRALAVRYTVFPFAKEGGMLKLAITDPLDVDTIDSLGHVVKINIEPSVAPADEIKHAIDRFYGKDVGELDAMLSDFSISGSDHQAGPPNHLGGYPASRVRHSP
jgi:type IV pilus assembly protein PilB